LEKSIEREVGRTAGNVVKATELANSGWNVGDYAPGFSQKRSLQKVDTWAMRNSRAAQFLSRQGGASNPNMSDHSLGRAASGQLSR
jgi:hypothetical protein